nr:hypothetical protein [uncultured Brevundimonas sp.]
MITAEFIGTDLRVRWAENPLNVGVDLYQIVYECAQTNVVKEVLARDFQAADSNGVRSYASILSWAENKACGLTRDVGVTIKVKGSDGLFAEQSEWLQRLAQNPPPAKPTLTYSSTSNAALVSIRNTALPSDYRGYVAFKSTDGSFNPTTATRAFDWDDYQGNTINLDLTAGQTIYIWVAAFDAFGKNDLLWSDRLEVLPRAGEGRDEVEGWVDDRLEEWENADLTTITTNMVNAATGAVAGVRSEVTAVDNRITTVKTQLQAETNAKVAIVDSRITTEVDGLKSRTETVETQVSTFNGNLALANNKITTLTNADIALGSRIDGVVVIVGNNRTAFDQQVELQSTNHTSQGTAISNLNGRVGSAESSISSLQNVTTNGTFATASSQSVLSGRVGTAEGKISSLESVTSNGTFASASSVSSISARLNNGGDIRAAIDSTYQVAVDAQGKANAQATLLLNAQGKIAGYRINNNGDTTTFDIQADRFRISDGSGTNIAPFRVENGLTIMQNARVDGNLVVNGTLNGEKVANDALTGVVAAYNSGLINLNNNSPTRLHGAWINVQKPGSPIDINFNSWATFTHNASGSFSAIVQLVRSRDVSGGDVIQTVQINGSGMANDTWQGPIPVMFIDNPGATGNWHYYVQIYFTVSNMSTQSVTARYCKLTELKNNIVSLGQGTGTGGGAGTGYSGGGGGGGGGYDPGLPGGGGYEQQPTIT